MFRKLVLFGLTSSLLAVCQTPTGVTVNGGYVAPAMPGAPLLTPPNVALPGSGPATGAPPAVGVNDSRTGGAGSVFQPSGGTLIGTELSGTSSAVAPTGTTSEINGASQPISIGMGAFSDASANQPDTSLADTARKYKAERTVQHPREFDNNSIRHASYGTADTNSASLPQGDQASATYGSSGTANLPDGVMNGNDYAAVQAALARTQAAVNTNATSSTVAEAMPDPNRSLTPYEAQDSAQQTTPVANQQGTATEQNATMPQVANQADVNAPAKKQLPASGSSLPLLAVMGLIALAVGGIFSARYKMVKA